MYGQSTSAAATGGPSAAERDPLGLFRALLLSVLVHAAVILGAAVLAALLALTKPATPEPEPRLRFTFAPAISDREAREPARGEVPFETPPATPRPPTSEPVPPPQADLQRSSATEATALSPALLRRSDDRGDLEQAAPRRTDGAADRGEASTTETTASPSAAPADEAGLVRPSAAARKTEATGDGPGQARPSLDLGDALRDYERAIARAQARQQAAPGASPSNQTVYMPDLSNLPTRGAPFGVLEFSSRDYDWSDYSSQIYWAILRAWYQRLYVTTADFEKWSHATSQWYLDHQSKINFTILRDGDVTRIALQVPAGCPPLDQSALDALAEVILPPLPADFPRDEELVRATFIARGEILNMRSTFRYLKSINYF